MIGTAPPQSRVLLIHQPGPWGPRGLLESRCDPIVAKRLDIAGARAGMRLQAIRRPGEHGDGVPGGGYHVGIAAGAQVRWWRTNDLADFAGELEAGLLRPPSTIDTVPLFLVCTHGRHDPCCALRGRPLVEALDRARPGCAWETTHLGGDRFAANVLVLPSGVLYGRVPASAASSLADCADDGRLLMAHQRGRIGLPPIAQAALVYAHETLSIDTADAFALETLERVDENTANVCLSAPFGYVNVTILAETRSPAQLTCRGVRPAAAREYRGAAITVSETRPHV
jgi:Sucrase/ferredoxin-like